MSNLSSGQRSRLKVSRNLGTQESNSPTLSSSRSERSYWARSYKNQPIPAEIRKRLIGKKSDFDKNSEDEEEFIVVLEEEQQQHIEKKKKRLPRFKVISDWGEFSDIRNSGHFSERKSDYSSKRCHSVQSLKLPQVLQEDDDELRKPERIKLSTMKDNDEFNQRKLRRASSEYTQVISKVESLQGPNQLHSIFPEQILENDAEQTKSDKLPNDKSILTTELQKLIVDELDSKKKRKEKQKQKSQFQSIEEERVQENENIDTDKLRQSLSKFQSQSEYLTNLTDQYATKNQSIKEIEEIQQNQSQKSD